MTSYEIQGRRMERRGRGEAVRNHVRLETADSREAALRIAERMAADKFTAWVFKTEWRSGRKSYALVAVVRVDQS